MNTPSTRLITNQAIYKRNRLARMEAHEFVLVVRLEVEKDNSGHKAQQIGGCRYYLILRRAAAALRIHLALPPVGFQELPRANPNANLTTPWKPPAWRISIISAARAAQDRPPAQMRSPLRAAGYWAFAASALASSPRALASATAFSNVLACSLALAASAVASAMCASDSAWTLSATLYSTKEEARETARAAAPNTAPTNISRSPQRSQTDAGNPQSIDWSVIAFFIYMTIFAAMAIATGFFSILAIRKRRGRF